MNDLAVINGLLTSGNPVSQALGIGVIFVSVILVLFAVCSLGR
jgi:hypothetical protein